MKKILKQGYNIPIKGKAKDIIEEIDGVKEISISPQDFIALKPSLLVKEGDNVLGGEPLFFHKDDKRLLLTSPISGKVKKILRGDRRAILEIIIESDKKLKSKEFSIPEKLTKENMLELLLESGLFSYFVRRPFGDLPNADEEPRDIFISAYLTHPLAPSFSCLTKDKTEEIQTGISALKTLTKGEVHLTTAPEDIQNFKDCQNHTFQGIHPTGNVGVQIHHIAPIKKGDIVWTISIEGLIAIGELLKTKQYPPKKIIALAGEAVKNPQHYRVFRGQKIQEIVNNKLVNNKQIRIISGDVLTGEKKELDEFLRFNDCQISVIPEVTEARFLGWMSPGFNLSSFSNTFFSSFFRKNRKFSFNTAINGGVRNLVQTGEYEKVLPMDILPQVLIKSILFQDLELMEQLGILEVIPEDLALCEYICVSKTNVQEIIKEGLKVYQREV